MRLKREKAQKSEQSFWNKLARKTDSNKCTQNLHNVVREDIWLGELIESLGNIRGKKVLDCGCGTGNLSAYLAMKGAYVKGFDISSEMLKLARANAEKNNTNDKCIFLRSGFEDLPYRDISFDLAVGAYILHHVDVERAVIELHRVLKPGGRAVFIETWGKNPLLVWTGKYLAGRFGIAKYGTKYEYPITTGDIQKMRKIFSQVDLEFPEFIFFKKAATNIFRWKKRAKIITDVLVKMDNLVTHRFPTLNKYGYRCIITLLKE